MNNHLPPTEPPASEACALARAAFELARPGDADSSRTKPAVEHVEVCPACQQAVRRQQLFDRQVEEVCRDVPLPAGLKERLLAAVNVQEPIAVPTAEIEAATRTAFGIDKNRARRRRLISLGGAAICALLASSGWLYWHWQPPVDLEALTLQAIKVAPQSLPEYQPGVAAMPLPATMKTSSIRAAPRLLSAGDASLYLFSVAVRGREPVEVRLLIIPASRVRARPTVAAFLAGQAVYLGSFCTTSWTEGDFVYVCCVKGGEDTLRSLAPPPRTAT